MEAAAGTVERTGTDELRAFLLLLALYTVSFGLSLLYPGIYWDDWVMVGLEPWLVYEDFVWTGRPGFGLIHYALLSMPGGVWLYKWVIFAVNLLNAWLFERVLFATGRVDGRDRRMAMWLFALFPAFATRHCITLVQYSICMTAFFGACWMLQRIAQGRALDPSMLALRLLALALLWLSYALEVHLVLTYVALPLLLWLGSGARFSFGACARLLARFADIFALPIAFWAVRKIYYPPRPLYASVNVLELDAIVATPMKVLQSFVEAFTKPLSEGLLTPLGAIVLFVALVSMALAALQAPRAAAPEPRQSPRHYAAMLAAGILLFMAAVFPFAAVDKLPLGEDWASRAQSPLPIAISLMIVALLRIAVRPAFQLPVLGLVLALSISANLGIAVEYARDWMKQESLLLNLPQIPELSGSRTVIIHDETPGLNARKRRFRWLEYTGMLHDIYGDETRLALPIEDYRGPKSLRRFYKRESKYPIYKMSKYRPRRPKGDVHVMQGKIDLSVTSEVLRLLWVRLSDRERYVNDVRDALALRWESR